MTDTATRDDDYAALSDEFACVEREATVEAERIWSGLDDEDRERLWKHGAAMCLPDASPAVRRELDHLAASKPLRQVIAEAAARFDARPLYRASIEARAELDAIAAEEATREIAEDRARAMARRPGEDLGARGIRMYGERSEEERADAERVWSAMSDEDRERVWKHGAAIVVPGANGSMCHNLGRLADEWVKASGIADAYAEMDLAHAARRIAELERELAAANARADGTERERDGLSQRLEAAEREREELRTEYEREIEERLHLVGRVAHLTSERNEAVCAREATIRLLTGERDRLVRTAFALARDLGIDASGTAGDVLERVHQRSPRTVIEDLNRRVAELQKEHAKVIGSRDRWRARAKRAAVQRPTAGQRLHAEFLKPPAGVSRTTTRGKRTRSKR